MAGGERYCLLVDRASGVPLYYPNLFVTTQVRNRSLSVAAMVAALAGISVFLEFMGDRQEDIEARFRTRRFLEPHELDAVRDYCQQRFRALTGPQEGTAALFGPKPVQADTEYTRLSTIARYTGWLAHTLLGQVDGPTKDAIERMVKGLKARRPLRRNRSDDPEKGLTEEQLEVVFEIFRPASPMNPFKDPGVRRRNRLMFLVLYHTGMRGGELLNLRIRDIDFAKNHLVVVRRPDQPDDPRTYQPLAKTCDRRLPLKLALVKELHDYIVQDRRRVPNADKHDYLFVTHKSGPTQGQPISISGYKRLLDTVRSAAPALYELTGHVLRHAWNDRFSRLMDGMDKPPSAADQEKVRSYIMGWKEGSGTAATYNKRFIREKANEAALKLQEGISRPPQEPGNGNKEG